MSSEDAEARQLAMSHLDGNTPMTLAGANQDLPPTAEAPKPKPGRLSPEEKQRRAEERAQAREYAKAERLAARMLAKTAERNAKIAEAEGGTVELPAVVLRNGHVGHVSDVDAWAVISMYLDDLMLDVETSGFPIGHALYELRTVQVGGEDAAIVFDASDPEQMKVAALALEMATRVWAHSASVDAIAVILGGLIDWDAIWAKMHDSVLRAKLTDPAMSGSDADALKELAADLLREQAVSPAAEKAKNELFKAMGCLVKTDLSTPPERNGWYRVNRYSVVMTRYAGSDVLDLGAVLRVLPPLPVGQAVMDREREFEAACAPVSYVGFQLDSDHVKLKIAEAESARTEAQQNVAILSDGKITNPKSPDVIRLLPELIPGLELPVDRKTKRPSAGKASLEKISRTDDPYVKHLCKQILEYRQQDTKLGLLLRPFEALCDYGDGRMRPTVYTIEASTGRSSCRRPNAQQLSRQGGVRACVEAGQMLIALIDGQWRYYAGGELMDMRGISADFEGCEIRVGAALSGDKGLYDAEVSPFCWKCETDSVIGGECSCGYKENGELAAHSGLHWRTAHGGHGKVANKEHRYQAKRGCVPVGGTEILTRRGWLKHDEVRPGDETPALQPDGSMAWTKVLAVAHYPDAPLERVSVGAGWSAVATPDHRWAVTKRRDGGARGRYFEDGIARQHALNGEYSIRLTAPGTEGPGLPLTDAEAALIAWAYADGHVEQSPLTGRTAQGSDGRRRKLRVKVAQAKPNGIAALEAVLTGIPHYKHSAGRVKAHHLERFNYELQADYARDLWDRAGLLEVADKHADGFSLTEFVLALTSSQRTAFLTAMEDAEGCRDQHGVLTIGQNEGPVLDAIELAGYLSGCFVRRYLHSEDPRGNAPFWQMRFTQPYVGCTRMKRADAGRSDVWCVQTETGTWTMRQDGGSAMITGNTFTKLFGGSPETAASQVYCDVKDMEIVFRAFDENAPDYAAWDKWLRQCYKEGMRVWRDYGTGQNIAQKIDGKSRMVYQAYSGRPIYIRNGEHAAGNGAIQGTARDLLVDGVLNWAKTRWGKLPLLPIHDQILAFVPANEAAEASRALAECMRTKVLSSPGFEVEIGADVDESFTSWPDSS